MFGVALRTKKTAPRIRSLTDLAAKIAEDQNLAARIKERSREDDSGSSLGVHRTSTRHLDLPDRRHLPRTGASALRSGRHHTRAGQECADPRHSPCGWVRYGGRSCRASRSLSVHPAVSQEAMASRCKANLCCLSSCLIQPRSPGGGRTRVRVRSTVTSAPAASSAP